MRALLSTEENSVGINLLSATKNLNVLPVYMRLNFRCRWRAEQLASSEVQPFEFLPVPNAPSLVALGEISLCLFKEGCVYNYDYPCN